MPEPQPRRGYIEGPEDYDAAPVGTVLSGRFYWSRLVKVGPNDWRWLISDTRVDHASERRDVVRWGNP